MGSGQGPAEPNFAVFDNWIHEPAYLSGMIAGKLTKSNIIGTVAAMDIPEVARLTNAFCTGAKEVNPAVKCKVSFIGSFFDPPKAKEAALAQIAAGVDVIYAERFGVIEAAQEKGILAFSNMSDQASLAPDTVVTGPVWDMWPTIQAAVKQVQAGVFTAQDFGSFSTMTKGGASLAPLHDWETKLPADVVTDGEGEGSGDPERRFPRAGERKHAGFGMSAGSPPPCGEGHGGGVAPGLASSALAR